MFDFLNKDTLPRKRKTLTFITTILGYITLSIIFITSMVQVVAVPPVSLDDLHVVTEIETKSVPRPINGASSSGSKQGNPNISKAVRTGNNNPQNAPHGITVVGQSLPEPPKGGYIIGKYNADPFGRDRNIVGGTTGTTPSRLVLEDAPPVFKSAPKNEPKTEKPLIRKTGGVLNGKALSLPQPSYPAIAKASHVSGTVTVSVVIDKTGKVISAKATGHPLLQHAAVEAAYRARFSPTLLTGEAVQVSGIIIYKFNLN
jgi:protein TonB